MEHFDQAKIIDLLDHLHIEHVVVEHPPAFTVADLDSYNLPNPDVLVKNLFLRDKKKNYYLVVVSKHKTVNLKELSASIGSKPLSFASEDRLFEYLGLTKGSVTPFGALNDTECKVQIIFDEDVLSHPTVGIHPNINTASLWLSTQDLLKLLEDYGHTVLACKL